MSNDLVVAIEEWLNGVSVPYAGADIETGMVVVFGDNGYIVPVHGKLDTKVLVGIAKRNIQRGEALLITIDERSDVAIYGGFKASPAPYYIGYIQP